MNVPTDFHLCSLLLPLLLIKLLAIKYKFNLIILYRDVFIVLRNIE